MTKASNTTLRAKALHCMGKNWKVNRHHLALAPFIHHATVRVQEGENQLKGKLPRGLKDGMRVTFQAVSTTQIEILTPSAISGFGKGLFELDVIADDGQAPAMKTMALARLEQMPDGTMRNRYESALQFYDGRFLFADKVSPQVVALSLRCNQPLEDAINEEKRTVHRYRYNAALNFAELQHRATQGARVTAKYSPHMNVGEGTKKQYLLMADEARAQAHSDWVDAMMVCENPRLVSQVCFHGEAAGANTTTSRGAEDALTCLRRDLQKLAEHFEIIPAHYLERQVARARRVVEMEMTMARDDAPADAVQNYVRATSQFQGQLAKTRAKQPKSPKALVHADNQADAKAAKVDRFGYEPSLYEVTFKSSADI